MLKVLVAVSARLSLAASTLSLVARALALISQWRGRDVLVRMPTDTTLGVDEHDDGVNEELAHLR